MYVCIIKWYQDIKKEVLEMKEFKKDYVVFDLETTGLDCREADIIEIGAIKYHDNEVVDKLNLLINPGYDVPEVITNITGITNELLKDKETIDTALPKFLTFIEDYPLVAHNSPFDIGFIFENMKRLHLQPIHNEVIDTLVLARKYIPQAYNHKLETLKNYFKIKEVSHRAIGDCHTTNIIYKECGKRAKMAVTI